MPHQPGHQPGQPQCPPGCCIGNEILCISVPCPIQIVLLGIQLNLQLDCIRLTSQTPLSGAQADQILALLTNLLGTLGGVVGGAAPAKS